MRTSKLDLTNARNNETDKAMSFGSYHPRGLSIRHPQSGRGRFVHWRQGEGQMPKHYASKLKNFLKIIVFSPTRERDQFWVDVFYDQPLRVIMQIGQAFNLYALKV